MVGAVEWGRDRSVRPEGRMQNRRPLVFGGAGAPLVPSRPTPHSAYTLERCALARVVLSECMYFLAGFLTENREGGES